VIESAYVQLTINDHYPVLPMWGAEVRSSLAFGQHGVFSNDLMDCTEINGSRK
jgi:hypothetical protein